MIKPELCEEILPTKLEKFDRNFIAQKKYDGTRAVIDLLEGFKVYNRYGRDYTKQFPEFQEAVKLGGVVLDGEIVYCEDSIEGKDSRVASQRRCSTRDLFKQKELRKEFPVQFVAFDIVYLDYDNIMSKPLIERLEILKDVVENCNLKNIKVSPMYENIIEAWELSKNNGWEGIIIKRKKSVYLPNRRSYDWIKVKHTVEEIVEVIGITEGTGSRANTFGALELSKNDAYVGKCGTGFTDDDINEIMEIWNGEPIKVKIKHYGYTKDGIMTNAVFVGLVHEVT